MRYPAHRWALPPLSYGASRAERRWQASADTRAKSEIRWIWNEVCSGTYLTRRMVPTGTASWEPPRIGRVSLGPPTTFTVELRPGQLTDDLLAVRDRLAAAYEVDDVEIRRLPASWVRIVLIEGRGAGDEQERRAPARSVPGATLPLAPAEPDFRRREPAG